MPYTFHMDPAKLLCCGGTYEGTNLIKECNSIKVK